MLFRKILYPYDFEEGSRKVKPYIKKLKDAGCVEVHILYVLVPSKWGLLPKQNFDTEEKISLLLGNLDAGSVDGLKRKLREMKELSEEFERSGLKAKVAMIPGQVDEVISNYAEKNDIKLIALGVSESSLSFFNIGKIVDIIKASTKPLLIVKDKKS